MGGVVVITVDGPAGVGKSTVARAVAAVLGIHYLDTGAYYRAAALGVRRAGIDPDDTEGVIAVVSRADLDFQEGVMLLDGAPITEAIRNPSVARLASSISTIPHLRQVIVDRQRAWVARHQGEAVVEGRDIGTVVFPEAPVKVYLTAQAGERARRRSRQDEASGLTLEEIERQLRTRDHTDSTRTASPLRPADDAVIIDTTHLTADEVIAIVLGLAAEAAE
jgi:cytidylate kinase